MAQFAQLAFGKRLYDALVAIQQAQRHPAGVGQTRVEGFNLIHQDRDSAFKLRRFAL